MSARPDCPGSGQTPAPTHNIHDGSWWPHGGKECPTCHGFYLVTKGGVLFKHKPHRGDNPYMAEKRQKLEAERQERNVAR